MQNMNDPMRGFLEQLLSNWEGTPVAAPPVSETAKPADALARTSSVIRTLPDSQAQEPEQLEATAAPALSALVMAAGESVLDAPAPAETESAPLAEAVVWDDAPELVMAVTSFPAASVWSAAPPPPAVPDSPAAHVFQPTCSLTETYPLDSAARTPAPAPAPPPLPACAFTPPPRAEAPTPSSWQNDSHAELRLKTETSPLPAAPQTAPERTGEQPLSSIWRIGAPAAPPTERAHATPARNDAPPPPPAAADIGSIWRLPAAPSPAPPPATPAPANTPEASTASTASIWRITPPAVTVEPPQAPQSVVPAQELPPPATASLWQLAPAVEEIEDAETNTVGQVEEVASTLPPVALPVTESPAVTSSEAQTVATPVPAWKLSTQHTPSSVRLSSHFESQTFEPLEEAVAESPVEPDVLPVPDWIPTPDSTQPNLDELWPDDGLVASEDATRLGQIEAVDESESVPQPAETVSAVPPATATRSLADFTSALAKFAAARRAATATPSEPEPALARSPEPENEQTVELELAEPQAETAEDTIAAQPEANELQAAAMAVQYDSETEVNQWPDDPSGEAGEAQAALLSALLDAQFQEGFAEAVQPREDEQLGSQVELEPVAIATPAYEETNPDREAAPAEAEAYFTEPVSAPLLDDDSQELGVELEWEDMAEPTPSVNAGSQEDDLATVVARLEASLPVAAPWDAGTEETGRAEQLRHLVFSINSERFGVRLENLLEVDNMPMWTGIPGMPHTVRGLINLRGEIVSLLDLRAILGLPNPESPKRGKIFVASTVDRQFTSAFAVDEVDGISTFAANRLKPVPALTQNEHSRHIMSTVEDGEQLVRILDVAAILAELEQDFSLNSLRM